MESGGHTATFVMGSNGATFVMGSNGASTEWAMGWSEESTQSALQAVIACANRLLTSGL